MTTAVLPAALLALVFAVAPGPAQCATSDPPPVTGGAMADDALRPPPDDHELTTFVSALVRLVGVQHGYMMMMQNEEDPARLDEIKHHAIEDMTTAVQQDGMSIDRYNAIATALKSDTGLQGRVESILRELADNPDDGGE